MLRLKRWIAATLVAGLLINTIPVNAFAEMVESTSVVESTSEIIGLSSTEQSASEVVEPTPEVTQTTQTSQETQKTKPQENVERLLELEETSEGPISVSSGGNQIQLATEGAIPEVGDTFADSFIAVLNEKNISTTITKGEDDVITLTIGQGQGEILALLSQQVQTRDSNYQNWNIKFDFTGELPLPDTFQGLGDWGESQEEQFPFKGKFTNQSITIKTSKTLFKALDASADLNGNKIEWEIPQNDATPTTPILTNILVADGEAHTVNMPLASANRFNPYIGQLIGEAGQVTLPALNYTNVGTSPAVEYPGNVGLVCCDMAGNTNLKVGAVSLPSVLINLKSSSNVGGLVGSMGDHATLTITNDLTLNASLNGANAGGLVGSISNATIDFAEGKTVTVNATLTATEAAGGIAGAATTETGFLTSADVVLQSVKANGRKNSGVLYGICTATGEFNPLTGVSFGENAVREVSGEENCGGLFGTLALSESGKCTISAPEGKTLEISTSLASATNTTVYGGVAGTLSGERVNALVLTNCSITSNINVGNEPTKYPQYLGGIVAKQVTATVDAKNSTVFVDNPKTKDATDCCFGGLVAKVGDGALLLAESMKVKTGSFEANARGGGVAGITGKGSIVYLKTELDLSECLLTTNQYSGQIVASQDCSLIYAPGVGIKRLNTTANGTKHAGMELDDIGNYGELYRLADFLTLDESTYATSFPTISGTNNEYTLSIPQDYACLALTWQARGYFPTVVGVANENWSTSGIQSSTITLNNDIDLTGCGIGGLTRDVYSDNDTFSGTLNGEKHKIILDIGAENQANEQKVPKGDGRIYWHNATGLFAVLSSAATVQNLTLDGSIRLSNNRLSPMYSGALAAQVNGSRGEGSTLSKVSTSVNYEANVNGANTLYLGGLIGQISGGTAKIDLDTGTSLASTITITHSGNGSANHFGGAIGGIAGAASADITCSGATIGGKINSTGTVNNLYAGGLIGTIWPATNSSTRNIILTNLKVNGFALTGSASERMSGILGGIWADTDVKIDTVKNEETGKISSGLSVTNTTLTANNTGNTVSIGALVYRASGKWTVSSADLSGLTINASNASALGLLVCHGEPYKEPINSTALNTDMNALYLEMAEHWEWNVDTSKGYNVPVSITFGGDVFDEFVAYTAYADRANSTPDYQITANGSGIISLKTENGTVNMTEGERNTYANRTTVGQSKQTNLYSRYYYNLPEVMVSCNGGSIDTANEFLIWSVYRYAASNLQPYFTSETANVANKTVIGGTSSTSKASFDMKGLSYYPINITNESVSVQYADVKFYNNEIEIKEAGNKSTRGSADNHSQHYTMHCALFLNFTAENITQSVEHKMTVNGVTFAGTVGVVNGGSGVLLCGTVKGESTSGNTVICKVILADADDAAKSVSLNGLQVMSETEVDYKPALINTFGSYAGLAANYVTTTDQQNMTAGSSLIGDVGGEKAQSVAIEFAGTIKLPDEDNSVVFTKATLLNSLRYENGSATYQFYREKEYPAPGETYQHNATYGEELSTTVEYANKHGCYNDGYGEEYYIKKGEFSGTGFSKYLPYVACSPAASEESYPLSANWHELAVNVLYINLTKGCGTYGHPYQITSENFNLLIDAAFYINTGKAANGWQIRISDNGVYHTAADAEGKEIVLTYTEGVWTTTDNKHYEGNVQQYLASAYYQINDDITLKNFNGIGTDGSGNGLPFTGVITGKKQTGNTYPTVTLSDGSSALIKYSYGSVVRDLNIALNQSLSLKWESQQNTSTRVAEQAPKTFFGGVMGCVLGGDNIIENVSVSGGDKVAVDSKDSKGHLVPMGGYVGVIAGGGVIFRGSYSNNTGVTGTDEQLYRNPFIGRVLGGYAFYEGSGTSPDNGNKNYKINNLENDNSPDLKWDGSILSVNNAQGLLILSAIVSSGAGSKDSNAYSKGVARNAKYDCIGQQEKPDDYDIAKNEGKISYLSKYVSVTGTDNSIGNICTNGTEGITIKFATAENGNPPTFDVGKYGNGYRALSARYVSNAAFKDSTVNPYMVVLRVKSFDGQNTNVLNINMDVREYTDDDFHAASLGGIFNIVWTKKQSGGGGDGSSFAQNLSLTNCNVSLKYVNSSGDEQNEASTATFAYVDGMRCVSVGGFIGMANDVEAEQGSIKHNYLFSNIHIKGNSSESKCSIYGPNSAGGLIGTTAMASTSVTGYPGKLLANGKWALFGPNFLNCSYSNIEVTGGLAAGGLIGDAYANSSTTVPNFSGLGLAYSNGSFKSYTSCTVTDKNLIVGQNATITARAKASVAGGLFGASGMRVGINDPEVNTKSGITIANASAIRTIQLSNVQIRVSQVNYNADGSNPDSGAGNAYAAGIIGRIGNVNPSCFYDISISGGGVTSELASSSYVGGMQGSGYTDSAISVQRCQISTFDISGKNAGGLLGSGKTATGFSLSVSECKLENCTIKGDTCAGGLVGEAESTYNLSNFLLKNTSITGGKTGRLFGSMTFKKPFYIYAAGVSVYADKDTVTIPEKDGYDGDNTYNGYIAYTDYAGTETVVENQKAPYVTVNPNFSLAGTDKLLTGDAVGKIQDDSYNSVAARIWADHQTGATDKKNLASYAKASTIVNAAGKTAPEVSTFREVQGYTAGDWGTLADLPVLVLKGNDASAIEDYLNVVTNGGYEKANVTPTVSVYYFNKEEKRFSLATSEQSKSNPASIYYENNQFNIRSRTFDNTLDRFSLVEASFNVKINGEDRTYTVSIPVVVIRELQFDFMATFSYGKEFSEDTFKSLKTHLLESTGNPFTAYLTYQYNREKTKYVEYDWQTYMDDGGSMLEVDKVLSFSSGLPADTQMILLDCQNGNQAYQYTIPEAAYDVQFNAFTSLADGTTKFRSSMAEILGVTATPNNTSGKFVEINGNDTKATVRLKGTVTDYVYYRPYNPETDSSKDRYDLTVPDLSKTEVAEENYYLVITVPNQSDPNYYINGSLGSSLNWTMPSSGTQLHRYDNTQVDNRNNTESTYQISTGYRQTLSSTSKSGEPVDLGNSDNTMQVKVEDTITFSNGQTYDDSDQLFLKLTVNLQEYTNSGSESEEKQFPVGTTGIVKFYVQDGTKTTYYKWDGTQWVSQADKIETASYLWESKGANMELLLSADGKKALDLSGVRQMIKGTQSTGDSQIIVTAEMDVKFGSSEVLNAAVPGSDKAGADTWAQLHYVGQISTQETSLSYSAMRAAEEDNAKYYQSVAYQAVLSMDAMQIDQLGVNPLQLVQDYQENIGGKNASRIDLTAALNLANLQNIESVLKTTDNITFTLSLQRKGDGYTANVSDASKYIAFKWPDAQVQGWSWTIPKDQYYKDGKIVMNDIFDGTQFSFPITAYVFTDQKDYANYKIKLTVSFKNSSNVAVLDSDAYVVYTFACIKPSFYEPSKPVSQ